MAALAPSRKITIFFLPQWSASQNEKGPGFIDAIASFVFRLLVLSVTVDNIQISKNCGTRTTRVGGKLVRVPFFGGLINDGTFSVII